MILSNLANGSKVSHIQLVFRLAWLLTCLLFWVERPLYEVLDYGVPSAKLREQKVEPLACQKSNASFDRCISTLNTPCRMERLLCESSLPGRRPSEDILCSKALNRNKIVINNDLGLTLPSTSNLNTIFQPVGWFCALVKTCFPPFYKIGTSSSTN